MTPPAPTLRKLPAAAAGSRPVHVAMIAPPYFDIPPAGYGGVEAVVADLVDGLVDRGHRVTLIGAGRHHTKRSDSSLPTSGSPRTS